MLEWRSAGISPCLCEMPLLDFTLWAWIGKGSVLLCEALPVWIEFHNWSLSFMSVCCDDDIAECAAAKDGPPIAFCSRVLSGYWSCLCCLAGESVCVAKSHCERPPHPWPGQSCHLCNGYHISAPLFMLSNLARLFLPEPLSLFTHSLPQITA